MTISTLLLILLLTFGAASSLDRFVRSHWLHVALTRSRRGDAIPVGSAIEHSRIRSR
jgi:hypothetical protein